MGVFSGPRNPAISNVAVSMDMASVKSYSGSGTAVVDPISRTTNELSNRDSYYEIYDLTVGDYVIPYSSPTALPTFSANNSGTVTFDGTNNSLRFATPTLGSTITVEMWARLAAGFANNTMFAFETYTVSTLGGGLGFSTSYDDLYGANSTTVTSVGVANTWRHYIFEMRTDVSYSNNKIYVDSSLITPLSQVVGTEVTANRRFSTYGSISSWPNVDGSEMPMTFSNIKIYTRALTQAEITQNYNATRSRFA
jgi:hypothetical protein